MVKQQLLEEIAEDIVKNEVCPELASGATQLVPGAGNPAAEIVFIGEAPGRHEDEQGEPFVGAAGKFLNEMLESIGLNRDDVFITNIVKYRPPQNRDPKPEEKVEFWPYLLRQLEVIDPKLIITLGRHSMEYFLPGERIGQIHGQPKRIRLNQLDNAGRPGEDAEQGGGEDGLDAANDGRIVILPLYHPAAALYNGSQRQVLMDDFAKIPIILEKL